MRRIEAVAEALKPLSGMNAQEMAISLRRLELTPKIRNECGNLDASIARAKAEAKGGLQMRRLRRNCSLSGSGSAISDASLTGAPRFVRRLAIEAAANSRCEAVVRFLCPLSAAKAVHPDDRRPMDLLFA